MKNRALRMLGLAGVAFWLSFILWISPAVALPPPDDTPEEILRTEIILEARSPLNGEPMTVADYAELQAQLEEGPDLQPAVAPEVRTVIQLLYIRRAIRSIFPFLLR